MIRSEFDYLAAATIRDGRVADFGDAAEEFTALHSSAGLVPLLTQGCLQLTGADRLDFLHGQISNEVKRLATGQICTALILNHKGHALAQMQVLRRDDDLLLSIEGGALEQVQAQLKAHIIFDQVTLEPVAFAAFSLQGPGAADALKAIFTTLPAPDAFLELPYVGASVLLYCCQRSVAGGFDILVPTNLTGALLTSLEVAGARLVGEDALLLARIEAGIPAAETEAGEGVLPQEAGLEFAVSYTKGCYLGQEIMARIEARGKLRRSLQGIRLSAAPGSSKMITLDGKKVGQLGAVSEHPQLGWIGLAVLRNDLAETNLELDEVAVQPHLLPFATD